MFARIRPAVVVAALATLFALPACKKEGESTQSNMGLTDPSLRMKSSNNLKIIGLALHSFHDANGYLPHNIAGPDGKMAGLSWRVAILPYIEESSLYKQFRLNEPWDSEHNRQLMWQIPKVYLPPGVEGNYNGYTYYQMFSGPGAFLPPITQKGAPGSPFSGLRMSSVTDGLSNTIAVAEGGEPVLWTKPDDLEFNANGPLPNLGGVFSKGMNVVFADGAVRFLERDTPVETLKALITTNGGEAIRLP